MSNDFERGYYCAVAALLREEGNVTTSVRSLFGSGGNPLNADQTDIDLFRKHGLLPSSYTPPAEHGGS